MQHLLIALFSILSFGTFAQIGLVTTPDAGMNDSQFIDICPCDTIAFELEGDLSNVTSINWYLNEASLNHSFDNISLDFCQAGVHAVMVEYYLNEDEMNLDTAWIRVSTTPNFSALLANSNYGCEGSSVEIEGGFVDSTNYSGFEMTSSGLGASPFLVGDFANIPDNAPPCYESTVVLNNGSGIISSIDEIESLFLNINHTFIGDLSITYTCPNGSSVTTHQQGGGGTNLGANGEGYDYYWNNDSTLDTWVDVDDNTIQPGEYQSLESFENFIGCPISGEWTLTVCDHLSSDYGFVNAWGINFPLDGPITFAPSPVDAYWLSSPWIIDETNTDITVMQDIPEDTYTFVVEDNFGCTYNQDFTLIMSEPIEIDLMDQVDMTCSHEPLLIEAVSSDNCSENNGTYSYCYGNFEDEYWLYCPDDTSSNTMMTVDFIGGFLEVNYDYIYVYDGTSTDAPLLATFNGDIPLVSFTASSTSGCLLIHLDTDVSVNCDDNEYDPISYEVSCDDAYSYDWSWEPANNVISPTSPSLEIIQITDDQMTFTATITNPVSPGCPLVHDVIVNAENAFDVGIDSEGIICLDQEAISLFEYIDGTPSEGGIWLDEFDNPTSGTFTPTTTGIYTFYYTSEDCIASSTLTIQAANVPATPVITVNENFMLTTTHEGYQWYLNEEPLEGYISQSYTASTPGIYSVEVFNTLGCSSVSDPVVIDEINTDNINEYQNFPFIVSPNPATYSTQIILDNKAESNTVNLYSLEGKLLRNYTNVVGEIWVQKDELESGVYLIEVKKNALGRSKTIQLVFE